MSNLYKPRLAQNIQDEIVILHESGLSRKDIQIKINEKFGISTNANTITKIIHYRELIEETTPVSTEDKNIVWLKDKLFLLAEDAFGKKEHDKFLKISDRIIAIFKIEEPVKQAQELNDFGQDLFKEEIKKLIDKQGIS